MPRTPPKPSPRASAAPRPTSGLRGDVQVVETHEAATLLLLGQGLLADPSGSAPVRRVGEMIESLGFVQLDSICVLERAHHLTLHTRLDEYRHGTLRHLLERDRALFEQWTHDASIIPVRWYPHWHHRFRRSAVRIKKNVWWRERMGRNAAKTLRQVREFVEVNGPTSSRALVLDTTGTKGDRTSGPWWGWRPEKASLEYLWRSGVLAVAARQNFEKVYDLSERVHGEHHSTPAPSRREHIDWACSTSLARLGVATPSELAGFWHGFDASEAPKWCADAIRRGVAVRVRRRGVDGGETSAVARPDWREVIDSAPPLPDRLRLLCPFDPLVRDRARLKRLFGFDYRFEAFVPKAKRVHGYYTLPMLDVVNGAPQFVGRLDARHDRDAGKLVVEGLWWEPGIKPDARRRRRLETAMARLEKFVRSEREEGTRGAPGTKATNATRRPVRQP